MTLTCSKCHTAKSEESFYRARREKKGRMSECIDCTRIRQGNTPRLRFPTTLTELYARANLREDGCRVWLGGRSAGYGKVPMGRGRKQEQVHRVAYELGVAPIPPEMQIHHRCGNKLCISVEHLAALTTSEHSLLHNVGPDPNVCRKGHRDDWYVTPSGDRRCRECVRIRRRRTGS